MRAAVGRGRRRRPDRARRPRGRPERGRVRLPAARRRVGVPGAARPRRRRARRARLHRPPRGPRRRPLRHRRRRLAPARRPTPSATSRTARPAPAWSPSAASPSPPTAPRAPHWSGFGAADLIVPELSLARRGRDVRLTVSVLAAPDDVPDELVARDRAPPRRAARARRCRCSTRRPPAASAIASTAPPEHYEAAVARAVERIRAGAFEKIVLAREVAVHAPGPHDAAAVFGVLRAGFDSCYVYCVGRGDSAFVGASPELLVRREGLRASTVALAGSTRRSADPAVDAHLGEQLLSLRQGPRGAGDRHAPDRPRAAPAQRLGRGARRAGDHPRRQHPAPRDADPRPAHAADAARSSSPALLHPTPAVGGEPHAVAAPQIPAFEGLDRGWYAGPVGWTDANEDGEFCVALRCALLQRPRGAALRRRRRRARLRSRRRAGRDRGQARRAAARCWPAERAPPRGRGACARPRAPRAPTRCGRRRASPAAGRPARSGPDSSCSSSVTSAWKRRPFLSTRTMSPAPMPFEVSARRGRRRPARSPGMSSSRSCAMAPNARRRPGRPPTPRGAARRSRRGRCARGSAWSAARRSAASIASRKRSGIGDAHVVEPVERGGVREVEPVRRSRRAPRSRRPRPRPGRKAKMPPPSLSSSTIVSGRDARAAGGEQAADVVLRARRRR